MSRSTTKVLYISGEISPFVRMTALADFMASFPQAMEDACCEARIMMPKYGVINDRKFRLHDVLRLADIEVHSREKTDLLNVKVTALPSSKIQTYFLYNEKYFKRSGLFVDASAGVDFKGSLERVVFFNTGVFETLQRLGWKPDVIHCHDWYAGLVPLLLKTLYADNPFFSDIRTVLTMHNMHRQGRYPLKSMAKLLPDQALEGLEVDDEGFVNLLATAARHADALTIPSAHRAAGVRDGKVDTYGLADSLKTELASIRGISNGLDSRQWNPSTDKLIKKKFDAERSAEKLENKKFLHEELDLDFDEAAPLLSAVVSLDPYQGCELLLNALPEIMQEDVRLVLSLYGDRDEMRRIQKLSEEYPGRLAVNTDFSDAFYHQVMASSDIFLMPAERENGAMQHFFAFCYGALPVAYSGAGAVDALVDITLSSDGSGFLFERYAPEALVEKVKEAVSLYADQEKWASLTAANMSKDTSWTDSAAAYCEVYQELCPGA